MTISTTRTLSQLTPASLLLLALPALTIGCQANAAASQPTTPPDYTVTVGAAGFARQDKPVMVQLDRAPAEGKFVRVTEAGEPVLAQFHPADAGEGGLLTFIMPGETPADATRTFDVAFASTPAPDVEPITGVDTLDEYQGQESFRVSTPDQTWIYHKKGAGFASLLDRDGNDWISYKPGNGPAGEYRGIPNCGKFHPGYDEGTSRVVHDGPVRVRIASETKSGWAGYWDIYPHYATFTITENPEPYWVLYEGTPGGEMDYETDQVVRAPGIETTAREAWREPLPHPAWAYFTDGPTGRMLFAVQHTADNEDDQYWGMQEEMTVFGFGRGEKLARLMERTPQKFTFGLSENSDLEAAKQTINAAFRNLDITVTPAGEEK
ncbi:MAG: hypothetical protein ACLFV3_01890 [Phycisphaeraceae bacterium]